MTRTAVLNDTMFVRDTVVAIVVGMALLRLSAMISQYFLLIAAQAAWDESLIEDAEAFCFHHNLRLIIL
jgi:hypothetical protein